MYAPRMPNTLLLLPVLAAMILGGCATREFVQQEVSTVGKRIDSLEGLLSSANLRIDGNSSRIRDSESRLALAEQHATVLAKRSDDIEAGLSSTRQSLVGIAGDLTVAQKQIADSGAEIARAHQRLDQADELIAQTNRRVQGTSAALAMAEGRVVALESRQTIPPSAAVEVLSTLMPTPVVPVEPAPVAMSPAPAATTTPAPTNAATAAPVTDANTRLDQIAALLAAADEKIAANAGALAATAARVSGLEQGLETTDKRTRESEDGLKQAQQKLNEVEGQLGNAKTQLQDSNATLAIAGKRLDGLESGLSESNQRITQAEGNLKQQDERLTLNEAADAKVSALAQEALERAHAAHKLAEGKLLYETVLTEDVSSFGFEKARLNDASRQALAAFANKLKTENQNVFIEIQGHTDSSGPALANMMLSRQRAEQVRDYLHQEAGIPIHRLAVVAYGETRPIADNKTKAGRIQNRRVVLVVLK
jgi:peptidoglycan-associated lipoprotein